jgi:NAD(P)H-hydrate epimerase
VFEPAQKTVFEPLYTAAEMRAAEERYPGYPETADELMKRAGGAVAAEVRKLFPTARTFAVVCGFGANGGDGKIAAAALRTAGREVEVIELSDEAHVPEADVVLDALFGTGFTGEPRPQAARLIRQINALDAPVVSVDVPSGVDASTGEVAGAAVRATATVTFHGAKLGLLVAPGRFYAGDVRIVDIGLLLDETDAKLVKREILELVPRKRPEDNKYSAGSVLVVGGSPGLTGALCLATEAAFRADAGYVAVAAPREALPVVEVRVLEAVKRPLEEVWDALERASALAIGPGLGRAPDRQELVRRLLTESGLPAVVDADGLHELEPVTRSAPMVLTPHGGELARLIEREAEWVSAHRLAALEACVERFKCVVLLKGADTLIGSPGEGVLVGPPTTPGLATAGTGDVLTGVVAAFLAKGLPARVAAATAATAHAVAAALAAHGRPGLVAGDVVAALPRALA